MQATQPKNAPGREHQQELVIMREFDAPRDRVMAAWSEPDSLKPHKHNLTATFAESGATTRVTLAYGDLSALPAEEYQELKHMWEKCLDKVGDRLEKAKTAGRTQGGAKGRREKDTACEVLDDVGRPPRCEF